LNVNASRLSLLSLALVAVIAAALRFGWVGVSSYAWDEARISYDALSMARGGVFALAGQGSSVGVPFFPASVWVFTLPYRFSADPLVATWFVAAINVLTAVGVWALARKWGMWAALIAGLFFAVNPYAVFYGRSIWQPNLLAPLSLAWIACAYQAATLTDPRRRMLWIALTVFIGGIAVQIHFAGIALSVATVYAVLRFGWYRRATGALIPVLIGAAAAGAAALPYLYYLAFVAPDAVERAATVARGTSEIDLSAALNVIRMGLGWGWAYLGGGDGDSISRTVITAVLAGIVLIAGLISMARMLAPAVRRLINGILRRARITSRLSADVLLAELALVVIASSLLFFLRHTTPVLPHYQLVTLPALALIAGLSARLINQRLWRIGAAAVMGVLAALWISHAAVTLNTASTTRPVNSALSTILNESRDAAAGISPELPVLFFTHGDDPLINGEVAVFETLWWERPHRILNGDNLLVLPPYPATIMATLAPFQAWEELVAAGLAQDVTEFPRRQGAEPFVATRFDGVSDPRGFTMLDYAVAFADGTTLEGWRARRVGDRFRVSTLWRVTDTLPRTTIQQFNHLYRVDDNIDGQPFMGSDVALSVHTWRRRDLVIVMADFFEVPAGDYLLGVGHYTLPDLTRIPRVDGAGDRVLIEGVSAD